MSVRYRDDGFNSGFASQRVVSATVTTIATAALTLLLSMPLNTLILADALTLLIVADADVDDDVESNEDVFNIDG